MRPLQKWLLLGSGVVTLLSGLAYGWMKYLMEPVDPWAAINHPLEPWALKLHILAAPVLVFAFGAIAFEHVWRHVSDGVPAGRRSGLWAAVTFLPMVLSGYLIQVVTAPGWLTALLWVHLTTGLAFAAGVAAHQKRFLGGPPRRR